LPAQAPTQEHRALDPATSAAIDSVFLDVDRTSSPGCAVGVILDGALAFADGYGSANLDHQIPITPQTVFYMGSVSKQFTAGAVALAAWQGHLSLDDDIRTWIPEIPDYGTTITVRHLIHHTSGLRDYLTLQGITGDYEGKTDEEIVALLARQRALNFTPGERYLYSNSGYFLLSEILERATGQTLRAFADRHFFRPLAMRNSHFHDDANHIVRWRATGYAPATPAWTAEEADADSGLQAGPRTDAWRMEHAWSFAQVGSGGLYSNVVDMARWDAAFEAGAIGPPGFRDALLERGVLTSGDTLDYAFGIGHTEFRGIPAIAHGGALAGFRSFSVRFPTEATSVLVLCNATNADPGRRAEEVAEIVLGDRVGPEPADEPEAEPADPQGAEAPSYSPTELDAFVGIYYSPELDARFGIEREGDGLVLVRGTRTSPLRAVAPDTFRAGFLELAFQRDGRQVPGFVLDAGRASGIAFERVDRDVP
jgi:CubicO group peptidase (beta-lactamase class C family)